MRLLHTVHTLAAFAALAAAKDAGSDTATAPAGDDLALGSDVTDDLGPLEGEAAERSFTDEEARAEVNELVGIAIRLRAEGHSLSDVIATAAKNAFGIDVR